MQFRTDHESVALALQALRMSIGIVFGTLSDKIKLKSENNSNNWDFQPTSPRSSKRQRKLKLWRVKQQCWRASSSPAQMPTSLGSRLFWLEFHIRSNPLTHSESESCWFKVLNSNPIARIDLLQFRSDTRRSRRLRMHRIEQVRHSSRKYKTCC